MCTRYLMEKHLIYLPFGKVIQTSKTVLKYKAGCQVDILKIQG